VQVPLDALVPADSPRLNGESAEHIRRLAETENEWAPIVVDRRTMKIVDGMHRYRAARLNGAKTIAARYYDGTEEDAFVLAVRLNARHGLPLPRADRTAAVERILTTHPHLSDTVLAGICGVSDKTVASIRRTVSDGGESEVEHRIGRDGRRRPVDATAGRARAAELLRRNPTASLRQVATIAGLSPSTVKDVRDRITRGEPSSPAADRREPPADQATSARFVLDDLQKDPALRLNHMGRLVLRLLNANAVEPRQWERLALAVPVHWAQPLARVADQYAQAWSRFSKELAARR